LRFFGQIYLALGANPMSHFLAHVFLESRLSSESSEPLIGFIAYLEPKLWLKIKKMDKNSTATNVDPGYITPMAVPGHNSPAD